MAMAVMAPGTRSISRFLIFADKTVGVVEDRLFFSRDTLPAASALADQMASRGYAARVLDAEQAPAVYVAPAPSGG
jgi:hypothetical protein